MAVERERWERFPERLFIIDFFLRGADTAEKGLCCVDLRRRTRLKVPALFGGELEQSPVRLAGIGAIKHWQSRCHPLRVPQNANLANTLTAIAPTTRATKK